MRATQCIFKGSRRTFRARLEGSKLRIKSTHKRLMNSSVLVAAAFAVGAPAATLAVMAAPTQVFAQASAAPADAPQVQEVVVTGSILRRKLDATDAPVTTVTADDLQQRGITTVSAGIEMLSANGAGSLPNSFTANGAFAAGASAVSLRGLTTNSTLTLIDGMRMTYYPLADDGTRNFVDLNTIPDVIVDRIETLKDGASSTYGADAIAGVVNVITKKTYEGITVKAEGGASEQGGGNETNFQALIGHGDLARDGYNVYVGVEYEHDDALYNRQRGFPYNTGDQASICGSPATAGTTNCHLANAGGTGTTGANFFEANGSFGGLGSTIVPMVRAVNAAGTLVGDYQLLNPAAGCGSLTAATVSPGQSRPNAAGTGGGVPAGQGFDGNVALCQQDFVKDYGEISPDDKRFSLSFRATKDFGANMQGYITANYYQNDVQSNNQLPSSIRQQSTPGALGLVYNTASTPGLTLPVYVCASGVNCSAANGTLNPNNPFASLGDTAQIFYRFGDIPKSSEQFDQTYRIAGGISGTFNLWGDWHYNVDFTGSQSDLQNTARGEIYIANLLTAVANGSYNFVNPAANSQAVRNFISPTSIQNSSSNLAMLQGSLSRELFQLPGGPLQLGLIASIRYESIDNPSANTDANGATNRYFGINPFGTIGQRSTEGLAFELDAPVVKQLTLNLSGRYDDYSTGQSNFSPKIGGEFKPFADWAPDWDRITFRSTFSTGFRIPSFAESNSLPTTGFVTASAPTSFQAAHGNDGYGSSYSLGETTSGTAGLKPETSYNFTAGFVINPIRQLSFSLDYYRITKHDFITANTANLGAAVAAYFAGTPIPAGYSFIPGIPDPNFPNAKTLPGFVSFGFTNAGEETTSGYDIGATARFNLPYGVKFTSVFDGNYVLRLNLIEPDGTTQHYAGTIGPYNDVSASGTPKFRANWQNTLAYGPMTFSITEYFTDGYQLEGEDVGDITGDCAGSGINTQYRDGTPIRCSVKPFWDTDLHTTYQVTPHIQMYLDVSNLFGKPAPYDPTTYGGYDYNPAWANDGIFGRFFKVGAKATF
jgi:iron complex outermembrane receptor protein